jgi:hypothetical protein
MPEQMLVIAAPSWSLASALFDVGKTFNGRHSCFGLGSELHTVHDALLLFSLAGSWWSDTLSPVTFRCFWLQHLRLLHMARLLVAASHRTGSTGAVVKVASLMLSWHLL